MRQVLELLSRNLERIPFKQPAIITGGKNILLFLLLVRPEGGIILKNLGFIVRTMPVAARKARHHFEEAIRIGRQCGGHGGVAQSLLNLGLLAKAKKRPDEARAYLEEAREVAAPLGWPLIEDKIDAAFADM